MRHTLICVRSRDGIPPHAQSPILPICFMLLSELPTGALAHVAQLQTRSADLDEAALQRLAELGFLPGEPVQVVQRGPGGREPLAVMVGDALFALRLAEAVCIEVALDGAAK
jgi:ferrous iron transport protein A